MTVTGQLQDFSNLYTDLQNRVREQTGVTATENQAKRYINIALHDMHVGRAEIFPWCERSAILVTHPRYTDGTMTINEGSTSVSGSSTAWDTNNAQGVTNIQAGGKFTVSGCQDVFEVESVTNDTTLVLTAPFSGPRTSGSITAFADAGGGQVTVTCAGHGVAENQNLTISGTTSYNGAFTATNVATNTFEITDTFVADDATGTWESRSVSAATYVYFEDEYALASDFLRPIDQQHFADSIPIDLISRTDFRRNYPRNSVPGNPKLATIIDKTFGANTTPVRKIRFAPPPTEAFNIPYSYATSNLAVDASGNEQTQLSADTDEPIVPLRYRHVIVFNALLHWYRDKKNDQRSQEVKAEYEQLLARITNDVEIGGRHASIRPRRGAYVRRAKRPWSGGTQEFDIDGKFDRMEI